MTLRSQVRPQNAALAGLSDFKEGQKIDAEVKTIEAYGIFLQIKGSAVRGLCHKTEVGPSNEVGRSMLIR